MIGREGLDIRRRVARQAMIAMMKSVEVVMVALVMTSRSQCLPM